jgi:hypothetical protein
MVESGGIAAFFPVAIKAAKECTARAVTIFIGPYLLELL